MMIPSAMALGLVVIGIVMAFTISPIIGILTIIVGVLLLARAEGSP